MSATGRGATRKAGDFYQTPEESVHALLDDPFVANLLMLPPRPKLDDERHLLPYLLLDPGAGTGAIMEACRSWGLSRGCMLGIEKDAERVDVCRSAGLTTLHADWLGSYSPPAGLVGAAIFNPPFTLAADFIRAACARVGLGNRPQVVIALLRLNWLGSAAKRRDLLTNPSFRGVLALDKRPRFEVHRKCKLCGIDWWGPAGSWPAHPEYDMVPFAEGSELLVPTTLDCLHAGLVKNPPKTKKSQQMTRVTTDASDYAWFLWGPPGPQYVGLTNIRGDET